MPTIYQMKIEGGYIVIRHIFDGGSGVLELWKYFLKSHFVTFSKNTRSYNAPHNTKLQQKKNCHFAKIFLQLNRENTTTAFIKTDTINWFLKGEEQGYSSYIKKSRYSNRAVKCIVIDTNKLEDFSNHWA